MSRKTAPAPANDDTITDDPEALASGTIEIPWDPSAAEAEEVELPTLWLDVRAVIAGDGDALALVNVAAIPKPTGPVKLAVVPMADGATLVNTFTMPRETYLALAAALMMCVGTLPEATD